MTSSLSPSDEAAPSSAAYAELAALVMRAQNGPNQSQAQSELYTRFYSGIHATVLAWAPTTIAHDLVHDVFVTVFAELPKLRSPQAFATWVMTIARRYAMSWRRKHHPTVELTDETGVVIEEDATVADATKRALAAIRSLPATYREPLLMRFVEGLTGPQIAFATGLTPASVRVTLHRGMMLLRQAMQGAAL